MAQTIKLKRSATQNAVPSTSSLALGELAINTYDGKLFIKKNVSGTESIVTIGEVGAGSIGPTELASTAVTAGSYGSTSAIPVITIDADGRITSASTATISGLSADSVTATEIAANAVGISELNVSDGTDGQVLTTDGNGNLAFEDQSGGAASATAFSTNIASGDGSTTAFTLSESPSAESKIIAFINGVFQNQDAYTISGTTLTFDTAPISGTNNVVVYVIGDVYSGESVLISNFSGNGTTTAFTLANNPGNENNTQVYIDGVYQQKTTYSVSGTTLTFSSAPPTGTNNIEVVMLTSTTVNTPAAGSVVTASMADDSVTASKIVSSAVTTAKIADDAVTIAKIADAALVIESEGIGSNDNDTTLPTSAAVKDYVDTQVAGKDALSELSGDTDDVTEGSTNLYFTNARADARITNALKDEDNMASNSATHIPSQQSVKAYVDSQVASKDALSELSGDTDDVTEGSTNLYYTDARVGTYISGNRTYGNITTTGYIAGPATFTIDPAAVGDNTGTVVIAGNLQVDGTTTTINSTTMEVDDLNITLASGAANAAAADGAGITVDGASATITYDGTNDEWDFNKDINVTGTITFDGGTTSANLNFGDNDKAVFGAGSDLEIYHDGSNSIIKDAGTGGLHIRASANLQLQDADGYLYVNCIDGGNGGTTKLYNLNQEKLATSSSGIDVTGTVTADGLTVDGAASNYNTIQFTSGSTGHGTIINLGDTSDVDYGSITQFATSAGEGGRMRFIAGTTETMNLRGGKVGIGTNNPSELLTLKQTTNGPEIKFENGTSNHYIRAYNDDWNFLANAANVALTIKNSGNVEFSQNVGIGADPSAPLHIDKSGGGDLLKLGGGNITEYVVFVDSNEVRQQVDPDNDEANSLFTWFIDGSRKAIFESHGLHLGGLTAKADLDIKQKGNSWENGILLQHDNANTGWNIHAERQGSSLWFGYNADTSVALASQLATEILCLKSNGNVGIKDDDPPSTLTVVGTNTADVTSNGAGVNGLQISRTTASSENIYAYMTDGSAVSSSWAGLGNVGKIESYGNNALEIGSQQNVPVVIGQNNEQKLRIKGDITAHAKWGATYTESIYTPNGGVQTVRIFEDALGKWVAVGYFAAPAYSSIQGTWSSVRGGPTGLGQSETTQFSADWGDSYPTEVRYLSATDFSNFQETKTIDFIHGVPRGRPWKQFFNNAHRIPDGGTEVSSSYMGSVQGPVGVAKNGWECRGAYDGFGRWHNPDYTHHRMSDSTNINCADTAFTTPTSNHFNWEVASDAKISVHHSNSYSGQDGISSAGFGNDDNIEAQFDDYPTDRSNFQSTTNNSTSAVYVLIKLPEMQPVGLEGGRSRDHQPGEIVQTVVYERNADVSATSGLTGTYGYIDFTPKYGNSLLEFSVDTTTGQNGSVSSCIWFIYQGSPSANGTLIRRTGSQIQAGYDQQTDAHPLPFAWKTFYQLNDDKRSTYRYRVFFSPSGGTYWGHTYGSSVYSYFSIKEIKQEHNAKLTTD